MVPRWGCSRSIRWRLSIKRTSRPPWTNSLDGGQEGRMSLIGRSRISR